MIRHTSAKLLVTDQAGNTQAVRNPLVAWMTCNPVTSAILSAAAGALTLLFMLFMLFMLRV